MSIFTTPAYILIAADIANNPHIGYQTWVRDLLAADISVSSETAGGPKDSILRPNTYEFWEPIALPAEIVIDLGVARAADYVGLAGHTIGSSGVAVKVQHSPDGTTWTDFGSEVSPTDDAPIMFVDESVTKRYWKIEYPNSGTSPQLAVIYIGQLLVSPTSIYGGHSPATLSRDTKLFQNMSDGGHFLGQYIKRKGVKGNLTLRHLGAGWYRTNFDPFVLAAREFPFFVAWRPVDWPLEVAYAWTDANIKPKNMGKKDYMEVSFNFTGIGYLD